MYDIVTYSTNDGYTGRFTNKDPHPDFYITYDTKWIDIAVELEAPVDITTLRGWTLNDEFFFGYDLGPGVENSRGIITKKKLYTSQIKARLFIRQDELTEQRRIDVCISTVVCRDLERLRVGEWIYFEIPDICFTLYLTELSPEVPESADSIGPDPIIDICPRIFACYGNIDSADINDLRVGPSIELDSDGIKVKDPDEGPAVKIDPSGVESKDPEKNTESKQSPDGLNAKDDNSGNEADYGPNGMGFGGPGGNGGLGMGFGPGEGSGPGAGGPGLGLNGPGGSAALGPEGLGFGGPGAGGEGGVFFGPEGMTTPPYKFSGEGIEYPEAGAFIKFNPDGETPAWEFNPPLPLSENGGTGGGGGAIPGLPTGDPGQVLSYRPPLDPRLTNSEDPSKLPRFTDDLPSGHFMDYALKPGRFVWDEETLEEEKDNVPPSQFPKMTPEQKEELFNSWPGFSQSPTAGNETNPEFPNSEEPYPPAGTQPFNAEDAAEWGYDPNSDTLKNDNPTDTFAGMTSPKGYNEYELEATLSSDTPTDGIIAVVVAEIKDPVTGKTNNLSAVRRPKTLLVTEEMDERNDEPYEEPSWGLVYNYGQPDEKWFETDNSISNAAPATTEPTFPGASHDDWVNAGPTRVKVQKEPDGIYVETSQFGSEELDPETGQYLSFNSEPELEQFNNKKTSFGFGSKNQPAKVSDIKFETSDLDNHIIDVKNNKVHAYVPDNPDDISQAGVGSSGYYVLDSSFGVNDVFGDGRLLFNDRTKELFWSDPENKFQLVRPLRSTDELPEGLSNLYYTDSRVFDYLTTNNYYTENDVIDYLTTNDYYTGNDVSNYLTTNDYYTGNDVSNYLTNNNYYTGNDVSDYLTTNDYYTGNDVSNYLTNNNYYTGNDVSDYLSTNNYYTGNDVSDYLIANSYYTENNVSDYLIANSYYTESNVSDYLSNNSYYTENDVSDYLSNNNYYTEDNVSDYLSNNSYYTENDVSNYLTTNNYYTENNVSNYLTTNNYYTENDVSDYLIANNYSIFDSADIISISGPRVANLEDLGDVNTAGATTGDVLEFDGANWVPGTGGANLGDLSDVNTAGATTGDVLEFDGANWVPGTGVADLDDLGDVNTAGATTGDFLKFDGANWVPGTGGAFYTAGDGIVLSSFSFAVNTTVLRTNSSQTITAGKKFNNGIILQFGTDGDMDIYHNAVDNIIDLRSGDLLIREYTTVGTTKFTFERSTGNFIAAGDITAFSDERLKSDIKTLDNSLEKVKSLRGVSYTKEGKPGIGLIAQEVEKILPEVVYQSDEFKSVAYGNIIGVLIEAVKELSSRVEELERDR